MKQSEQSRDEVSALARGLTLVREVAQAASPLSNRDLVTRTGIPKATVSRLTATLVTAEYLRQHPHSERFSLGPAVLDLNNAYLRNFDLRAHARPHLAELADFGGVTVHLCVPDALDMLVIDTVRPRTAVLLSHMDVGARMAMATSAAGRAYLSVLSTSERQRMLEQIRHASARQWRSLRSRIATALEHHASHGYCSSFGEWNPHIHALGVGLQGPRGDRYAISCGGAASVLGVEHMRRHVAPRMLAVAHAIARDIGAAP